MVDSQLKRGILDVCVLSLLRRGDSYGYQIIKDLAGYVSLSESTLYPILRRLEMQGSLTVYSVAHNGRLRKMYHLTDVGKKQMREFLMDWTEIQRIYDFIKECAEREKRVILE